jgi:outer membrane autotransporter protein
VFSSSTIGQRALRRRTGTTLCVLSGVFLGVSPAAVQAQICGPAIPTSGVSCGNALQAAITGNAGTLPANIFYTDAAQLTINLSGGLFIPSSAIGVFLTTGGAGTINVSGGVTNTAGGIGYSVVSGGAATINVSSGANTIVGGVGYSANAIGAATVNLSSGIQTATGGIGVQVAAGGIAVVNVSGGSNIAAGGIGISANGGGLTTVNFDGEMAAIGLGIQAAAAGNVTVQTANRSSIAVVGAGIFAAGANEVQVFSSGSIDAQVDGVIVDNSGTGSTAFTSVAIGGRIDATDGDGVRIRHKSGPVSASLSAAVTAGDEGLDLESEDGAASVSIGGALTGGTDGARVKTTSGAVSVNVNSTTVGQNGDGIDVTTDTGNVSVRANATVRSDTGGDGIRITSGSGNVNVITGITSTLQAMTGAGLSITTGGEVKVQQDGEVRSTNGSGIVVRDASKTDIVAETKITAGADGIDVLGAGAVVVDQTVNATVKAGRDGLVVGSTGGPITVNQNGRLDVGRDGIVVAGTGGTATSTVNANVAITAPRTAIGGTGPITGPLVVNANAALIGQTGRGIDLDAPGSTAPVTVNVNAPIFGDLAAIKVETTGTTTVNVRQGASLASAAANDIAIEGAAGGFDVANAGTITGAVRFGPNVIRYDNSATGVWFTHTAGNLGSTSQFGGVDSVLSNTGTIVAARDGALEETVLLNGLSTLANGALGSAGPGLVTLQDGAVGDRLTTTGTFVGAGTSTVAVDAFLGPPGSRTDVLTVGTATAGRTAVAVNNLNPGPGSYNPDGIVVVDVSGGTTAPEHFFLPNGPIKRGLFTYDLLLRADNIHVLAGVPDQEVFEMPRILTATQSLWYDNTVIWFERQNDLRDRLAGRTHVGDTAVPSTGGVWAQAFGALAQRDDRATFALHSGRYTYDTGTSQQTAGVVAGLDGVTKGVFGGSDALVLGVMGGYTASEVQFTASRSGTTVNNAVGSAGVYGTYLSGPFFVDALVKGDFHTVDYTGALAPFTATEQVKSNSIGGRVDAGVRFGSAAYVEPIATLAYVSTTMDDLAVGGSTVQFDDAASLRGRLGLRVGGQLSQFGNTVISGSLTGSVWQEFQGQSTVDIVSGGPVFSTSDQAPETYSNIAGTLDFSSGAGGFTGYVKGEVTHADNYMSERISVGQKYRW